LRCGARHCPRPAAADWAKKMALRGATFKQTSKTGLGSVAKHLLFELAALLRFQRKAGRGAGN